jgi:hypothetical protein
MDPYHIKLHDPFWVVLAAVSRMLALRPARAVACAREAANTARGTDARLTLASAAAAAAATLVLLGKGNPHIPAIAQRPRLERMSLDLFLGVGTWQAIDELDVSRQLEVGEVLFAVRIDSLGCDTPLRFRDNESFDVFFAKFAIGHAYNRDLGDAGYAFDALLDLIG